jgi:heptose-I-phosphate ethanolaminephosphotransferase
MGANAMALLLGYACLIVLFAPAVWIFVAEFGRQGAAGAAAVTAQVILLFALATALLATPVTTYLLFAPFAVAFMVLNFLNLAFYLLYRQAITDTILTEVLRFNPIEWREFIEDVPLGYKVAAYGYGLVSAAALAYLLADRPTGPGGGLIAAGIALITAAATYRRGLFFALYPQKYVRQIAAVVKRTRALKRLKGDPGRTDIEARAPALLSDEVFVLVIGESVRPANLSLYGYGRETTPFLTTIADELIVFEDAVSPSSLTHEALKYALTPATVDDDALFFTRKTLLNATSRAGLSSTWISNQPRDIVFDLPYEVVSQEADRRVFLNDDPLNAPLDGDMLPLVFDAIEGPRPAFVVVHMFGSHYRYEKRVDDASRRFTHDIDYVQDLSCRVNIVDNYDNTILYLDKFLEQVITGCRERRLACVLGFMSDHGEMLFDNDRDFGHALVRPQRKEFEVPYFYWASPEFRRRHPRNPLLQEPARQTAPAETQYVFADLAEIIGLSFENLGVMRSNLNPRGGRSAVRSVLSQDRVFDFDRL